jgi:hypothetical protein
MINRREFEQARERDLDVATEKYYSEEEHSDNTAYKKDGSEE